METKTQHMRRMRLRRKYWRVTPTSERITINPIGANEMCKLTIDSSDDELERGIVAARAMLAALLLLEEDFGSDYCGPTIDAMRAAIAQAKAAGIGEEG